MPGVTTTAAAAALNPAVAIGFLAVCGGVFLLKKAVGSSVNVTINNYGERAHNKPVHSHGGGKGRR